MVAMELGWGGLWAVGCGLWAVGCLLPWGTIMAWGPRARGLLRGRSFAMLTTATVRILRSGPAVRVSRMAEPLVDRWLDWLGRPETQRPARFGWRVAWHWHLLALALG